MLPESAHPTTSDLRFAQIAAQLKAQEHVLEKMSTSLATIEKSISEATTNSALSAQDRAVMRRDMEDLKRTIVSYMGHNHPMIDELKKRSDSVHETVAGIGNDVLKLRDTLTSHSAQLGDHEDRLRSNERLMSRVAVAVILAVILPLVLFALQRMFP